jgi:hypothetical protein
VPSFKRYAFNLNAPSGTIDDSHETSLTLSSVSAVPNSKGPAATTIELTGSLAIITGGFEPLARTAAPIPAAREMPTTTRRAGHSASCSHFHDLPVLYACGYRLVPSFRARYRQNFIGCLWMLAIIVIGIVILVVAASR